MTLTSMPNTTVAPNVSSRTTVIPYHQANTAGGWDFTPSGEDKFGACFYRAWKAEYRI